MDDELKQLLATQQQLLEKTFESAEKTRKYILAMVIIMVVSFVLPLIATVIIAPMVLKTYTSTLGL